MWFQYVVGYDRQEQRSLATALHNQLFEYRRLLAQIVSATRKAVSQQSREIVLIGFTVVAALLVLFAAKRVRRFGWRRGLSFHKGRAETQTSTVVFYQRLLALLARRGVQRDPDLTPLEFASELDQQPVLAITRAYNRVRFGGQELSVAERREIERELSQLETDEGRRQKAEGSRQQAAGRTQKTEYRSTKTGEQ
jgi:hypothetical protein